MISTLKNIIPTPTKDLIKNNIQSLGIHLTKIITPATDPYVFVNRLNRKPKIAVVKQSVYSDLYNCPPKLPPKETILSSNLRSGAVGLFTLFDADFYIVKREPDAECQRWKDFCIAGGPSEIEMLKFETEIFNNGLYGHVKTQGEQAIACDEIDWNRYDIVVCYEIPIPMRIIKLFPKTTWCYYIVHENMLSYLESLKAPLYNYDFFLSQKYDAIKFYRSEFHELYFPYHLHYFGCFHDLMGIRDKENYSGREGIYLEKHSAKYLSGNQLKVLEQFGTIKIQSGSLNQVITDLLKCKYFVRFGGAARWGNSMIESIAAGCLFIGNSSEFRNKSLFTPRNNIVSFEDLINKLNYFDKKQDIFFKEIKLQQRLLNYYCFVRPMTELLSKIKRKKKIDFF